MASDPLLDFEALLAPIAGENPAGGLIPFEIRQKLEESRKEENPDDFPPDDPMRPEKPKKADWAGIVKVATETLASRSKDLLVAARLTEALVKEKGFAGLRDGLRLMRRLVEECWDRLNPPIEDGDMELRAGPLHWLDDPIHGARFPSTLRMIPLVFSDDGSFSWLDWRQSQDGEGLGKREAFEKAIQATPAERLQAIVDDMMQSLEELQQLAVCLNAKMGPAAPGLTAIRQALDECRQLEQEILRRKLPPAASADDTPGEGKPAAARSLASRDEAYRQLAQAAALLQHLEPHSPIPYLVQRAVELGAMPFPQLMKALIRDSNVLTELNRELGIKEAEPDGS